jgi:hypothetical protein
MVASLRGIEAGVRRGAVESQGVAVKQVVSVAPGSEVSFTQSMLQPLREGVLHKASAVTPVRELGGPAKALNDLSTYLSGRHQAVVRMMDEAVRTGSPEQMVKVTAAMIDNSTETDLLAKTVGKTVSAVDQLTKLS